MESKPAKCKWKLIMKTSLEKVDTFFPHRVDEPVLLGDSP
jgi:hypothetical protein